MNGFEFSYFDGFIVVHLFEYFHIRLLVGHGLSARVNLNVVFILLLLSCLFIGMLSNFICSTFLIFLRAAVWANLPLFQFDQIVLHNLFVKLLKKGIEKTRFNGLHYRKYFDFVVSNPGDCLVGGRSAIDLCFSNF